MADGFKLVENWRRKLTLSEDHNHSAGSEAEQPRPSIRRSQPASHLQTTANNMNNIVYEQYYYML